MNEEGPGSPRSPPPSPGFPRLLLLQEWKEAGAPSASGTAQPLGRSSPFHTSKRSTGAAALPAGHPPDVMVWLLIQMPSSRAEPLAHQSRCRAITAHSCSQVESY